MAEEDSTVTVIIETKEEKVKDACSNINPAYIDTEVKIVSKSTTYQPDYPRHLVTKYMLPPQPPPLLPPLWRDYPQHHPPPLSASAGSANFPFLSSPTLLYHPADALDLSDLCTKLV